jgi:hypothetical protein
LGVTRGRLFLMISSAAHPRWPPSWIWTNSGHAVFAETHEWTWP